MHHDGRPVPLSPSKGKAREETRWRTGWWDFTPLVEHPEKPLVWSEASIIFSVHPTRLDLTGRHFASSKQFLVPPPTQINSAAAQYCPPSFISIAPGDKYLFAFYPGKSGDGVGCIWRRGPRIDSWLFIDCWKFAKFTHPVAAEWLGSPRTWYVDVTGSAERLPSRGPQTPVSSPTLLYITSDHRANLCYLRFYRPLRVISCPLDQNSITLELAQPDDTAFKCSSKQCTLASIGLAYNEPSIVVATRVRSLPSQCTYGTQLSTTLDIPVDPPETISDAGAFEWELWGEGDMIHLCELRLQFDGVFMSLHANPLLPVQCSTPDLFKLTIVPSATGALISTIPYSGMDRPVFHMVAAFLDFGDYTSAPKSEMIVYTVARKSNQGSDKLSWHVRQQARRSFHPEVLCFFVPFLNESKSPLCYAGVIKTSGSTPKKDRTRKVDIGYIKVLRLFDLSDDDSWQPSSILSRSDNLGGHELPLNTAVSPNGALITIISPWLSHASVHSLPKRKYPRGDDSIPYHSIALASAVLLGRCTSDITHVLSVPTAAMNEVVNVLRHTARLLDRHQNGIPYRHIPSFMGLVIEVNKARAQHHSSGDEKENLELHAQILFDILSLKAFNEAFEECRNDEGNADLSSIWHLIGLSEFIVHFVENLMKEGILRWNPLNRDAQSFLEAPALLPFAHPYALQNVCKAVGHVAKLRTFVGSLPAGGEKESIAKAVLLDLVDFSGVDFATLEVLLTDCSKELTDPNICIPADDCWQSLALCQPVPSMYPQLGNILRKISDSNALDKSTLFVKPADLIDGVQQLSLTLEKKESEIDAILKKPLANQTPESVCVRCGGASLLGSDLFKPDVAIKWRMWEKMQMPRCICYGFSMKAT